MKTVDGKCSIEFQPQGPRYSYHPGAPNEDETLEHVLKFCERLNKTFNAFFGGEHRDSSWWTAPVKLDASDELHVPIDEITARCNTMLAMGMVTRALLGQIETAKGLGEGIVDFDSQAPFPSKSRKTGGQAGDEVLKFTAQPEDQVVGRIYYTDENGKVHCVGVQNLMVNGSKLLLTEEGIGDSAVAVKLKVDFIVQP